MRNFTNNTDAFLAALQAGNIKRITVMNRKGQIQSLTVEGNLLTNKRGARFEIVNGQLVKHVGIKSNMTEKVLTALFAGYEVPKGYELQAQ